MMNLLVWPDHGTDIFDNGACSRSTISPLMIHQSAVPFYLGCFFFLLNGRIFLDVDNDERFVPPLYQLRSSIGSDVVLALHQGLAGRNVLLPNGRLFLDIDIRVKQFNSHHFKTTDGFSTTISVTPFQDRRIFYHNFCHTTSRPTDFLPQFLSQTHQMAIGALWQGKVHLHHHFGCWATMLYFQGLHKTRPGSLNHGVFFRRWKFGIRTTYFYVGSGRLHGDLHGIRIRKMFLFFLPRLV